MRRTAKVMMIWDFIEHDIDIDVCDDYDESCYIAYCGATYMTDEGKRKWADVLNQDIEVYDDIAIVHAEDDDEVNRLAQFFYSIAGYCAEDDWNKWFKYEE